MDLEADRFRPELVCTVAQNTRQRLLLTGLTAMPALRQMKVVLCQQLREYTCVVS